jgi:hypothetical protein
VVVVLVAPPDKAAVVTVMKGSWAVLTVAAVVLRFSAAKAVAQAVGCGIIIAFLLHQVRHIPLSLALVVLVVTITLVKVAVVPFALSIQA